MDTLFSDRALFLSARAGTRVHPRSARRALAGDVQPVDRRRAVDVAGWLRAARDRRPRTARRPHRGPPVAPARAWSVLFPARSEEHTSALQSLMRTSYAVFCLKYKLTLQLISY